MKGKIRPREGKPDKASTDGNDGYRGQWGWEWGGVVPARPFHDTIGKSHQLDFLSSPTNTYNKVS